MISVLVLVAFIPFGLAASLVFHQCVPVPLRACSPPLIDPRLHRSDGNSAALTAKVSGRESMIGTMAKLVAAVGKLVAGEAPMLVAGSMFAMYFGIAMCVNNGMVIWSVAPLFGSTEHVVSHTTRDTCAACVQIHHHGTSVLQSLHESVSSGSQYAGRLRICWEHGAGRDATERHRCVFLPLVLSRCSRGCWFLRTADVAVRCVPPCFCAVGGVRAVCWTVLYGC